MPVDTSEKDFEATIEAALLRDPLAGAGAAVEPMRDQATRGRFVSGGYRKRQPEEYDRALCLIPAEVFDFIYATQPREWDKMQKQHGADARNLLLRRLASEIRARGTLEVLRKGIKANGCKFRLAHFRPASGLNESSHKLYRANLFSIVRQLKYSEKNEKSLDLGVFLNGLPISTAELKNPFKQQNVKDGVRQYRLDRDPKEPLFGFGRCLAHFAVDPNLLYDLQTRLDGFHLFTEAEVNQFARIYFDPKGTQDKLHAALAPVLARYREARVEDKDEFRSCLNDYIRLYAFLSQVIPFADTDLEKLYVFAKLLWRVLPNDRQPLPVEVQREIDLDSLRVSRTGSTRIKLDRGTHEIDPMEAKGKKLDAPPDIEPLSRIIQELNERFGTNFTEQDKVFIQQLEERIAKDRALAESVRVNPPEDARLTFDHVVNDRLQEKIDTNFKFYKQVTDDPEFAQFFLGFLFKRYYEKKGKEQAE